MAPVPSDAQTLLRLRELHDSWGPQTFGRIAQNLLALAFKRQDWSVSHNNVGVPDFSAQSPAGRGFVFEAKTTETGKVRLTTREMKALESPGQTGIVATLMFPDLRPRWLLTAANQIFPERDYGFHVLAIKTQVDVGFRVDDEFRLALAFFHADAMADPSCLHAMLFD